MSLREDLESAEGRREIGRRWLTPITASLILVGLTTALLWALNPALNQDHLIFIYFVPTALIAIRFGSTSAMCVTIASSAAAAYFLYEPQFSFQVTNRLDMMELVLFCMLAVLASQVVSGFARDREVAKRRRRLRPALARAAQPRFSSLLGRIRAKFSLR